MPFTFGLPETACGAGSTVAFTESIRSWLTSMLYKLGIGTLLDAPCGDFNWMACTDLSSVHYVGIDYDELHCAQAMVRASVPDSFAPRSKSIVVADICTAVLPQADLVLCRDFLQHLPNEMASRVIGGFRTSGSAWLLATSHDNPRNADIARPGMFRPLNLTIEPFCLPPPLRSIADGSGRILGLWQPTSTGWA